jgi:hypothetical protein
MPRGKIVQSKGKIRLRYYLHSDKLDIFHNLVKAHSTCWELTFQLLLFSSMAAIFKKLPVSIKESGKKLEGIGIGKKEIK